jgi:eukaryotic-like serine/threonine-protein kinase
LKVTDVFVLPEDLLLIPLRLVPADQREGLEGEDDDVAITRTRGRTDSKVVDASLANLVEEFRQGRTIVEAVHRFAHRQGRPAEVVLDAAYPILKRLIESSFLVPQNSPRAGAVTASLSPSETWGDCQIVEAIQVLEDTELYRAKTPDGHQVALKIARSGSVGRIVDMLRREARILQHVGGAVSPALLREETFEGRRSLTIAWCHGVVASRAAAYFRSDYSKRGRENLLALAVAIADGYARLHALGVVHGDVHPGNLIVSDEGAVTIIDFGLARMPSAEDASLRTAPRGGLGFFYEPEYAAAKVASSESPPQASFEGEQHVLAHMLYQLLTGYGYARFSPDMSRCMGQLAESRPLKFSDWGVDPWPDVETALNRALDPDPARRHETVASLRAELERAQVLAPPQRIRKRPPAAPADLSQTLVEHYLVRFNPAGGLFERGLTPPPVSSVTFGSAGVACFLYRMALIRQDARLLSWAKLWIEKALAEMTDQGEAAFVNPEENLPRSAIGPVALYHTETGLFAVKALIAHAMGDIAGQATALAGFINAAAAACQNIDVTLGTSGVLLGATLLTDALPEFESVKQLGDKLYRDIWATLEAKPAIADPQEFNGLGIAHGWSGVAFVLLRWCAANGTKPPPGLRDRLLQLEALAQEDRSGVHWPRLVPSQTHRHPSDWDLSWCNGTAGFIYLWTAAHRMYGDDRWLELAKAAAWNVVEGQSTVNQICCGRPGQAYAILNLFKLTKDPEWLGHARTMAADCLQHTRIPDDNAIPLYYFALYKGPLGTALLSAEFDEPENSCLPLFESEQWR